MLFSTICATIDAGNKRHGFGVHHGCARVALLPRGGGKNKSNGKIYEILEEKLLFSRWRTLLSRLVRFPDGRTVDFDVVGNKGSDHAVLVFAWNSQTKTATIIREYMPGSNSLKAGIAAGLVESKHSSSDRDGGGDGIGDDQKLTAAMHELEEECHLVGGEWIKLTEDTLLDKYSTTQATVYLNLNAKTTNSPKPLDAEEEILIIPNVTIAEIMDMIAQGEMNCVGGWASLVAIHRLRELGEI